MKISLLEFVDKPENYIAMILEEDNAIDTIEITSHYERNTLYLTSKNPNSTVTNVIDNEVCSDIINQIEDLDNRIEKLENRLVYLEAKVGAMNIIQSAQFRL